MKRKLLIRCVSIFSGLAILGVLLHGCGLTDFAFKGEVHGDTGSGTISTPEPEKSDKEEAESKK